MSTPTSGVEHATTTVAGRQRANSGAMLGPDRTAIGLSGTFARMISLGRASVAISTPLVTLQIGTPAGTSGPSRSHVARKCWHGTAEMISSLLLKAARASAVGTTASSSGIPGRYLRFSRSTSRACTRSARFASSATWTSLPARICATTVPIAPAPTTAALVNIRFHSHVLENFRGTSFYSKRSGESRSLRSFAPAAAGQARPSASSSSVVFTASMEISTTLRALRKTSTARTTGFSNTAAAAIA